jgi:hypothetical protein
VKPTASSKRDAVIAPITLLMAVLVVGIARAHNGELPPPPTAPPAVARVEGRSIPPPRWTWLHWWEANREKYLISPSQSPAAQTADPAQLEALRYEAVKALQVALDAPGRDAISIEAAMALGKLRHEPGLGELKKLAASGDTIKVRRAALLAIGLLGSQAAESDLSQLNANQLDERVAGLVAMGLLPKAQSATVRHLRSVLDRDSRLIGTDNTSKPDEMLARATVVSWALRQHGEKDHVRYFSNLVNSSDNAWIASEALLGLGATRDRATARILEDALFASGSAVKALGALQRLNDMKRGAIGQGAQAGFEYEKNYANYVKEHEKYWKNNPNRPPLTGKGAGAPPPVTFDIGYEMICMAWLRSSAAIAMGSIDEPRAGQALLSFVKEDIASDEFLVTPKSFAVMSLASYPSDASRDRLIELLGKQDDQGKLRMEPPKDSPIRGFAALALGLYARPYSTDQGPADRAGFDRAIITLAERLEDEREEEEVRTACAVALGLAQRTAVLPVLYRLSAKIEQRNRRADFPVYGFLLLGRSLAGDQNLVEPAAKFLLDRDDDTTPSGILSRRAAVLGLGMTRNSLAIPVLTKAWHLNHYVNREVIVALRLVGGASAATPVMERLRQSKDNEERAYMAQALGELLAVEQPTTLNRLIAGSNFTVRNDNLLPLYSLANGFLYDYLIGSLGDLW